MINFLGKAILKQLAKFIAHKIFVLYMVVLGAHNKQIERVGV